MLRCAAWLLFFPLLAACRLYAQIASGPIDVDADGTVDVDFQHEYVPSPFGDLFHRMKVVPMGSNAVLVLKATAVAGYHTAAWGTNGMWWNGVAREGQQFLEARPEALVPEAVDLAHDNVTVRGPFPRHWGSLVLGGKADWTDNHVVLLRLGQGPSARAAWLSVYPTEYAGVFVHVAGFGAAAAPGEPVLAGANSRFQPIRVRISEGKPVLVQDPLVRSSYDYVYEAGPDPLKGPWTTVTPSTVLDPAEAHRFIRWRWRPQ